MRVLVATNMYPCKARPAFGTFVQQQVKGLTDIGVEVEVMLVDRVSRGPFAYYGLGTKITKRLANCTFDLIHIMYGGVLAAAITEASDWLPRVVSICGSDLLGTTGRWPIAWLRSWVSKTASIKACKMADAIVVKSQGLAKALPATIARSKVYIIPNGVDLDRFRPIDRELCVGELGWEADTFHIVFALGEDPLTKRLRLAQEVVAFVQQLGVCAKFHVIKGVPHEKVPIYLNAGDVLLVTSIHEGSPNIVKEGLACNLPIVSVDVGDVAERIGGIEGCHIVPPIPASIAFALKAVALRRSRIEGRLRVLHLSLVNVAKKLEVMYRSVLETRQAN